GAAVGESGSDGSGGRGGLQPGGEIRGELVGRSISGAGGGDVHGGEPWRRAGKTAERIGAGARGGGWPGGGRGGGWKVGASIRAERLGQGSRGYVLCFRSSESWLCSAVSLPDI